MCFKQQLIHGEIANQRAGSKQGSNGMLVLLPRTPGLFHVPNSPCLGVKWPRQELVLLYQSRWTFDLERPSLPLPFFPFFWRNRGDGSVIKKILFMVMKGGSFCRLLGFFLINASESTVAALGENHGRDVNRSGITFEMEFSESLSEEMFELKL